MNLAQFIMSGYLVNRYLEWEEDRMTPEEIMVEIKKLEGDQFTELATLMMKFLMEITSDVPEERSQILNNAFRMAQEHIV